MGETYTKMMNRKKVIATIVIPAAVVASLSLFVALLFSNNMISLNPDKTTTTTTHTDNGMPLAKIVKTAKVDGWTVNEVGPDGGLVIPPPKEEFKGTIVNGSYEGIDRDNGTAKINTKNYFLTTLHGNLKSIVFNKPNGTAIEFAGVTFTFPHPPNIPLPSDPVIPVIIQFSDGANETLYVQVPKDQPVTLLTEHKDPRAGITVMQGADLMTIREADDNQAQVKLLVSIQRVPSG